MKITFAKCAILPAFIVLFGLAPVVGQSSVATNSPAAGQLPPPILDNDEMMQLKKAREQVLAAHVDLKAEEEKLMALHQSVQNQNPPPTADQRNAMFAEWKAYQKTMRAEMLKIDPTLEPIFAKLDAARKHGAASPFAPATGK